MNTMKTHTTDAMPTDAMPTEMEEYVTFCMSSRQNTTLEAQDRLYRALLGLGAEVGELQGVVEKTMRRGQLLNYDAIRDELGDVIHLWATVVGELRLDPDEIVIDNIIKVSSRRREGYYGEAAKDA